MSAAMADGGAPAINMLAKIVDTIIASPPQKIDVNIRKEIPECWIFYSNNNDDGLVPLT